MKKRVWSLLLAAALTVGLFAGLTVPARAAGDFLPESVEAQVTLIDTTDWLMMAGQDHVLWVYNNRENWSASSLMTGVVQLSLREQGSSRDIYALKTDQSLWQFRDMSYEGNTPSMRFSQPVRIMTGVKEISGEYALTTGGAVYQLGRASAQPTGRTGVATIAANDCRGQTEFRGQPFPCKDPGTVYFYGNATFLLSESGDLWSWGESERGGLGISLRKPYSVAYSHIYFYTNYEPRWRTAPVTFSSAPERILTDVRSVWIEENACYAVRQDGTLWKWGDGQPVEVYFNGSSFSDEVKEPSDQTGWTPRQVSAPGYWEKMLNNGSVKVRFYADGRATLLSGTEIRLKDWASDPGNATPFTDVKSSAYYYDAVKWALDQGITTGITATSFGPDKTVTRGQCVTFLWRAMGQPEPAGKDNPFLDVKTTDYFYKAVLWAGEEGITNGVDASHFNPGGTLSTLHILTFLYRALDQGTDGWYDGKAGDWAQKAGLLTGTGAHAVSTENCPRANVVTFLYRQLR